MIMIYTNKYKFSSTSGCAKKNTWNIHLSFLSPLNDYLSLSAKNLS